MPQFSDYLTWHQILQSFVFHTSNMTYAYQWQLQPLTTFPEFVPDRKAAATDFMEPEDLQCISHVSPEPDESYKEGWLRERFDKLTLTHIYWTQHKCAVSVSLTSTKCNMYIMDHSVPHIPLAKHTSDSWEDLSQVMKSCNQKHLIDLFFFPPTLQCYSKKVTSLNLARLNIHLNKKPSMV